MQVKWGIAFPTETCLVCKGEGYDKENSSSSRGWNNGMLPIVQPREVREKLAQLKPTDQVTVDLEQQKIISPVGEFTFEIDSEWKHKLLNGLDDIGITLQYEDLIAAYEKQRPAYWQD